MRKRFKPAVLLVLLVLAFQAAGCQPNPTVPPVVGKGNLEDKIKDRTPEVSASGAAQSASAAVTASAGPQKIQRNFQQGKLAVNIDASVELPAAGKLPVVKASPRKFTQAEADTIVRVLFQGKQPNKPKDQMTKAEIEKALVEMKAVKANKATGENKDKINQKIDMEISRLEEQLKMAPETVAAVASDGKFKNDELGGQELYVTTPLGKTNDATLDIYCSASGRTTSAWFNNEEQGSGFLGNESAVNGNPRGVKMTKEDAQALAEKTVDDLGADLKLASISIGTSRGVTIAGSGSNDAPQCWLFAFTREVNGVPSVYEWDFGASVPQEEIDRADKGAKDYAEPHPYERILMAVDDTGILEFQWVSPDKVLETVSEDAQILPQQKILQTFEKQFFLRNALKSKADEKPITMRDGTVIPASDNSKFLREAGIFTMDSIGWAEDIQSCTFNVNRVTLSLSRIAVKDKETEFLLVPVWDFFGTATVAYTPESGYAGFTTTEVNRSLLTVNAIDGSIINRSYGY